MFILSSPISLIPSSTISIVSSARIFSRGSAILACYGSWGGDRVFYIMALLDFLV